MAFVLIATERETLHAQLSGVVGSTGAQVRSATSWSQLVRELSQGECGAVLIDASMSGVKGELLAELANSLNHAPALRSVAGELPPLKRAPTGAQNLARFISKRIESSIDRERVEELKLLGLGEKPFAILSRLTQQPLPVRIQGERGSNKEGVALAIHRLSNPTTPFVKLRSGESVPTTNEVGTLFLKELNDWQAEAVERLAKEARLSGWRLIASSRHPHNDSNNVKWAPLYLEPLRDRPDDLRALTLLYINRYRRALGLPRRRVARSLWTSILAHRWPGNSRELENFVVQMITSAKGGQLSVDSIPDQVRRLLQPASSTEELSGGFEEVVEAKLRPIVEGYEVGGEIPLYRLTINATERALLKLALVKTGGDQLAASKLLGIARNTLRSKVERLDI